MISPRSKPGRIVAIVVLIIPGSYPLLAALSALLRAERPTSTTTAIGLAAVLLTFIAWMFYRSIAAPIWAIVLTIVLLGIVSNIAASEYDPRRYKYGPK